MANITTTGTTGYPSVLDTRTTLVDGSSGDEIVANHPNGLGAAVIAIETELGTLPKGSTADVKTRLAVVLADDGTFKNPLDISGAAQGQIKFPATQNASANANTLDDYSEGTWTPSVGGNATYTTQIGRYKKIGKVVYIQMELTINVLGTGSTTTVSGLPYTAASVSTHSSIPVHVFGSLATSVVYIMGEVVDNTSTMRFSILTAASTSSTSAGVVFGNSTNIGATGWYETAN